VVSEGGSAPRQTGNMHPPEKEKKRKHCDIQFLIPNCLQESPIPPNMFPTINLSKALTLGGHINVRVLRDHAKREAFAAAEQTRQALRYVDLPPLYHRTPLQSTLSSSTDRSLEKKTDTSHKTHNSRCCSGQRPRSSSHS